jgi:hypothetical protein
MLIILAIDMTKSIIPCSSSSPTHGLLFYDLRRMPLGVDGQNITLSWLSSRFCIPMPVLRFLTIQALNIEPFGIL